MSSPRSSAAALCAALLLITSTAAAQQPAKKSPTPSAAEQKAKDDAEKEAKAKAEKEAADKAAKERAEKERAEKEAKEQAKNDKAEEKPADQGGPNGSGNGTPSTGDAGGSGGKNAKGGACADALTMIATPFYVGCQGAFEGNIGQKDGAEDFPQFVEFGGAWNTTWTLAGKSDESGNGPFAGAAAGTLATPYAGTLPLDAPVSGWFIVGIKQANFYSFYLYNAVDPVHDIAIDSRGTAPGNDGFSHVNLYRGPADGGGAGVPDTTVPEPSTYALLGTGILAIAGVAHRRRKQD